MKEILNEKITESLSAVVPITLIVLALSVFVVPLEVGAIAMFLVGAIMLIFGIYGKVAFLCSFSSLFSGISLRNFHTSPFVISLIRKSTFLQVASRPSFFREEIPLPARVVILFIFRFLFINFNGES